MTLDRPPNLDDQLPLQLLHGLLTSMFEFSNINTEMCPDTFRWGAFDQLLLRPHTPGMHTSLHRDIVLLVIMICMQVYHCSVSDLWAYHVAGILYRRITG